MDYFILKNEKWNFAPLSISFFLLSVSISVNPVVFASFELIVNQTKKQ